MVHWLNYRAVVHFVEKRYEDAIETSIESLSLEYNTPWNARATSHQMLAASYAQLGDLAAARSYLGQATDLRPSYPPSGSRSSTRLPTRSCATATSKDS